LDTRVAVLLGGHSSLYARGVGSAGGPEEVASSGLPKVFKLAVLCAWMLLPSYGRGIARAIPRASDIPTYQRTKRPDCLPLNDPIVSKHLLRSSSVRGSSAGASPSGSSEYLGLKPRGGIVPPTRSARS